MNDTAFDRELSLAEVVRGLLQAVSLFPVGSTVQLTGGLMGRVLRANAHDVSVIERKAFNSHDLVENLRLALRRPARLTLPPPR